MPHQERARRRATLIAAAALAVLLAVGLWVAQSLSDQQTLERCLSSGRRDCGGAGAAASSAAPPAAPRPFTPAR